MSGLGHLIEAAGLSTVAIGLVPQHLEQIRPPRALAVPFELGRPLGAPNDPESQRETLSAALNLVERSESGPVLDYLDVDPGSAAQSADSWVCPVSFPSASDLSLYDRLLQEVNLLRPWWDKGCQSRGFTATGASGLDLETLIEWLTGFSGESPPRVSPVAELTLGDCFKLCVEELKAYYLEAVTARPGEASSSDINNWFWDETAAGDLLWQLREQCTEHPDEGVRLHAGFTLVPGVQVQRARNQSEA